MADYIGTTQVPLSCIPATIGRAIASTDSIILTNTDGVLTADVRVDGATGGGNNLASVEASGLLIPAIDVAYEILAGAFADPDAPTTAEAQVAFSALATVNPAGSIAYYIGGGTTDNPDWLWWIDAGGVLRLIDQPQQTPITIVEITAGAFADPLNPTEAEVATAVAANGWTNHYIVYAGTGTAENPDYVWRTDYYGVLINVESPRGTRVVEYTAPQSATDILCRDFAIFDMTSGSYAQPLPPASSVPAGCRVGFKAMSLAQGEALQLVADGSDTIDGAATYDIDQDTKSVILVSNGTDQWIVAYDYDPLALTGILCSLAGTAVGSTIDLSATPAFLIDGETAVDFAWEVRQGSASGTLLAQFSGGPGVAVVPSGYLTSGTYDEPTIFIDDYCGDLWVGVIITDSSGHTSPQCGRMFLDFNLVTFTFVIAGDGAVNFQIALVGGATQTPTWSWGDGSPDSTGQSASHVFSGGQSSYVVTAQACANEVYQVRAQSNRLIGNIDDIVDWTNLVNVSLIWLQNNQLVGPLDPNWGSLQFIGNIDISNNPVGGTLPPEWGVLSSLGVLNLNTAQITGAIPPEWGGMTWMNNLSMGYNQLSGSLPPELSTMGSTHPAGMQTFYVEHNQFTGTLPPEYAAWTNLNSFWVGTNMLEGGFPPEYAAWTSLTRFHVETNQFVGPLPPEYESWTILTHFTVQNNQIAGVLPPEYDAWTGILYFQAGNNLLSGTLPPEYGSFVNIRQFYVQNNYSLTGTLPATYGAWTQLLYGGFHETALSGPVPASWSGMISLIDIYFGGGPVNYSTPGAASGWSQIKTVYFGNAGATSSEIEALLAEMVSAGVPNNGLFVSYNVPGAPMTAAACASLATLQGLGWTTAYDTGGAC